MRPLRRYVRRVSLLERERELAELRSRSRAAAAQGCGGVVAVRGVAGVGKTALLKQAAREAAAAGFEVLWATGSELERDLGFGVVRQLFEPPLRVLSAAERGELLSGAARLAGPVVLAPAFGSPQAEAATLHGLRSMFRDWCGERTNFERQIIEFALAHKLPDRVEAAYRRETAVEKRRKLMQSWASYCAKLPGSIDNVVALKATA